MFTIIRFTGSKTILSDLYSLGNNMNEKRKGLFTGPRKAGDGFSCQISENNGWSTHYQEILNFLEDFQAEIIEAKKIAAAVTIDVAVEPEDRISNGAQSVIRIDPYMLSILTELKIAVEVSCY